MLRKQIINKSPSAPSPVVGQIDVAAVAAVLVTSEGPDSCGSCLRRSAGSQRDSLGGR